MQLSDFILQRIDEDEAVALGVRTSPWDELAFHDQASGDLPHIVRHNPTRVLAECEAKRRIIADLQRAESWITTRDERAESWIPRRDEQAMGRINALRFVLKDLAAPHADHPDYQESWK